MTVCGLPALGRTPPNQPQAPALAACPFAMHAGGQTVELDKVCVGKYFCPAAGDCMNVPGKCMDSLVGQCMSSPYDEGYYYYYGQVCNTTIAAYLYLAFSYILVNHGLEVAQACSTPAGPGRRPPVNTETPLLSQQSLEIWYFVVENITLLLQEAGQEEHVQAPACKPRWACRRFGRWHRRRGAAAGPGGPRDYGPRPYVVSSNFTRPGRA